jgi:hypothetical protein
MSQSKPRMEYYYEVYLYSEPYFMLLEDECIIDINLKEELNPKSYKESKRMYGIQEPKKYIEFQYDDVFFDYNLKNSKRNMFSIVVVVYNRAGQFLQQMDLHGEDLLIEGSNLLKLYYDQITNNQAFPSINPLWGDAIDVYKRERVSYLRDVKIDTLLK